MDNINPRLHTLMRRFHFTIDDLDANRAGRMTSRQRARLLRGFWVGGVGVVVLLIGAWLVFTPALYNPDLLEICASAAMILFILALYLGVMGVLRLAECVRGRVNSTAGIADIYAEMRGRAGIQHYLRVGNVRFEGQQIMGIFGDRGRYRVYYTPLTRQIISGEPLP